MNVYIRWISVLRIIGMPSKTVESGLRKELTCEFISDNFDIPIETVKQIAEEMSCTV